MIRKADSSEKVYQKKEYIILKVRNGYVVYNTNKKFENGHTHLKSFEMSKTIIDNSLKKKKPKTNNTYLIESHIRLTTDNKYIAILNELLAAKNNRSKDNKYYNKKYCYIS